ncbi:unnamed protein product [Ixodes persulcatus]
MLITAKWRMTASRAHFDFTKPDHLTPCLFRSLVCLHWISSSVASNSLKGGHLACMSAHCSSRQKSLVQDKTFRLCHVT